MASPGLGTGGVERGIIVHKLIDRRWRRGRGGRKRPKWVVKYTWAAVNIPGRPSIVYVWETLHT